MALLQGDLSALRRNWLTVTVGVTLVSLILIALLDRSYFHAGGIASITKPKASPGPLCPDNSRAGRPADAADWYPPSQTKLNDIGSVVNGSDVYGFIFNSSTTPPELPYATYNWCNMPHVRAQEYQSPGPHYTLQYVELIHRHHKRTPYASNIFPKEEYTWDCSDSSLYYYGVPASDATAARINWQISDPKMSPFPPKGFPNSTCQFPQITLGGLLDSRQHGRDLRSVYVDLLHFLPAEFDAHRVKFRVTNNIITSQVASQVAIGLYPSISNQSVPVAVQPAGIDSLEPQYPCPQATKLYATYGIGSNNPAWLAHLDAPQTTSLLAELDAISGVDPGDREWHVWFDHYFDNLSSKLCHRKLPLGCSPGNRSRCITPRMADAVFRRGLYEYSYIYRDHSRSLRASVASFGVWMAELAAHLREAMATGAGAGAGGVLWRHNIAHDGSLSRLLSMLQLDRMVWPGMGSEVVFELWTSSLLPTIHTPAHTDTNTDTDIDDTDNDTHWSLRILWQGQPLQSSSPALRTDASGLLPATRFLEYVDALVGRDAAGVQAMCATGVEDCTET